MEKSLQVPSIFDATSESSIICEAHLHVSHLAQHVGGAFRLQGPILARRKCMENFFFNLISGLSAFNDKLSSLSRFPVGYKVRKPARK